MARLVVLRGQTPFREVELVQFPVRIGRGQQNDVVLEDPLNSVSRNHAEIRFENGRYLLVDAGSENGIWVAGMRENSVALDPNVVASIGPFRLTVEGAAAVDAPAAAGAPIKRDAPSPAVVKPTPEKPRTAAPAATAKAGQGAPASSRTMIVGVGLLALVAVIAGAFFWLRPSGDGRSAELVQHIATAQTLMGQGECARALAENIQPALAIAPDDSELLALKQQVEGCIPPPPPPPPAVEDPAVLLANHLATASQLIDGRDCATALNEHINKVLESDPANVTALELKKRAEACSVGAPAVATAKPPAAAGAGSRPPQRVPPENGGLDVVQGETDAQYQARIQQRRAAYDQAVALLQSRNYTGAISGFEAIRPTVPAGYLELDANLATARKALRSSAQTVRTRALDLEKSGNYDGAIREFRRAHDADPDLAVDADIKRVSDLKVRAGEEACEAGRKAFAVGNVEAYQAAYQKAFALLPQGHACYDTARVRGGVSNK